MKQIIITAIQIYKKTISPHLGVHCRFTPTCSEYTCQAVEQYGTIRGLVLGFRRLLRCHPFTKGGYDPVK